jgi:hypothetical protein
MTATNIITHENMPFEDYLALPGNSFSGLKHSQPFEPTPKMRLGTACHNYLMTPQSFVGNLHIVKPLAMALRDVLGSIWHYLKFEVSTTADFEHEGFKMPYKGRIDAGIRNKIVIDFKVGENIKKSMDLFKYPEQLTGYSVAFNADAAFIIAISPKGGKPDIIPVEFNHGWWEEQVLMKGTYSELFINQKIQIL